MNTINHGIFNLHINNNIAVMDFNPEGTRYPVELVNDCFQRELAYLDKLKKYQWAPEVLDIDISNRSLSFLWYNNTCEDFVPKDYKEQLLQITKEFHKEELIKPNLYTKYFYTDPKGIMHTYAFYSTSDYAEQPINIKFYSPILNQTRKELVDTLTQNDFLDMRVLLEQAYTNYIKWPDDPLPLIYEKTYLESH